MIYFFSGGGQKPQFPELENELYEWLKNQTLQSKNITKEEIKEKALSIYVGDKFVASDRWASAFMKRYHRKQNNSHIFHDDLGVKYLVLFSSCSLKMREKYISFAQFVYFLREVCLLFNF